jgi:tetratricopeptide (TPR) repeat protein
MANFTRDQKRIDLALNRWAEVDPTDSDIYMLKTPFLMMQGKHDEIAPVVNTALAIDPEKLATYLVRLTDNLSKIVKADPALMIMKQLDVFQQGNPHALYHYSRLAVYYQRYDKALPTINAVLDYEPDFQEALILKATILQRLKRIDEALNILKDAAHQKSASRSLRFSYAQLLGENNQIKKSRQLFEQLDAEESNKPDVIFALGVIAIEEKQGHKAKNYFKRLQDLGDPGMQSAYFLGIAEKLNNNVEQALVWFSSVPNSSLHFQKAQTQYVSLLADNGALAKARQHLANIRIANPKLAIDYYLFEAILLQERKQNQPAFFLLDKAISEHPENIDLLYTHAMLAESINRLDILEKDLRSILAIDPDNSQTLNALGYTLTDLTDRHQEALVLIKKALVISPSDPFYLDSLGWVYYRLGQLDKAEQVLKQAVAIREEPEFLAHLGEVLWQQDQKDEAKKVWLRGLKQDSANKLILKTMQHFGL